MIKTEKLTRTYGTEELPVLALRGVSIHIKKGEFVGIMGRSGSGKSTLLHQLGLLDTPTSGKLIIDKKNTKEFSNKEKSLFRLKNLGYVFQEYALLPELTSIEAVSLPLMMIGLNSNECKIRATQALEAVELGDRLNHLSYELSGGEQQRVAIARAIVNTPKILFADEPCANLDSESSDVIINLFKKLNKKLGQTIVMVSHEPEDKNEVDRVIWLKDGLLDNQQK